MIRLAGREMPSPNAEAWKNLAALLVNEEQGDPVKVYCHVAGLVGRALLKAGFDVEFIARELQELVNIYFQMHHEAQPASDRVH